MLAATLWRPWTTVGLCVAVLATATLFTDRIGTELMPEADEGRLEVELELPVGTPLRTTSTTIDEIAGRIRGALREGELEHLITVAGPENWWRPAGSNQGSADVLLVKASDRERTQDEIIAELHRALADIPGADIRIRPESSNLLLRVMRGGGDDRLSVDIIGHDLQTAETLAKQIQAQVRDIPGVVQARIDRELGQLERTIIVDRGRLGELGLGAADVAATLEHYVLGYVATQLREGGDEYDLRVVLDESERSRLDQLAQLPIALPSGGTVALGQVARIDASVGPSSIARENQRRILKVGIGIAERDLGGVVADLEPILAGIAVPHGFEIRIGGEYLEQQETFSRLTLGGGLALFLVFAVMAVQFESLRGPLVVMTAIPFAIVGVIVTLVLTKTTLNMNSALGVIVLFGVVINNAIVLIDYINVLRRRDGLPLLNAIARGARVRLRPVLMTTLTTALGMMPLALSMGEGGELQSPLARTIVGGLVFSSAVTLVFVPCLYLLMERRRRT
jgi:HAE1 family hydrophobic/amphiphilic exporter-1